MTQRKNLVLGKQFREALEDAVVRYTNKQFAATEMITKGPDPARFTGTLGSAKLVCKPMFQEQL